MADGNARRPSIWWKLAHLEPAVYRGIVVAVFGLLASLGVVISPDIPDQVVIVIMALLPLIQGLWTRAGVVAEDKVVAYVEDPTSGTGLKAGPAAPAPYISKHRVEEAVYEKAA